MQTPLCGGKPCLTMEAPDTSSISTCSSLLTSPDSDEYDERNVWNPLLNLLCHEHVGALMESYLDEAVLGRLALFCHLGKSMLLSPLVASGNRCRAGGWHIVHEAVRLATCSPLRCVIWSHPCAQDCWFPHVRQASEHFSLGKFVDTSRQCVGSCQQCSHF